MLKETVEQIIKIYACKNNATLSIGCLRFQPEEALFLPDVLRIRPLRDCNSGGMLEHFICYESIKSIDVHKTREKDTYISREEKEAAQKAAANAVKTLTSVAVKLVDTNDGFNF